MTNLRVRPAEHDDVKEYLEVLAMMHAESRYAGIPIDEPYLRDYLTHWIGSARAFVWLAESDAEIIGVMIGFKGDLLFSRQPTAVEQYLYVKPGRRGTWAALKLVDAFVAWGTEHECVEICAGVSAGCNDEKGRDFYRRIGFNLNEPMYRLSRSSNVRS